MECDQLVDILLICWWWGNWESMSSTWFQPILGLNACGQHTVNFSTWCRFSICRTAQNSIHSPWGGSKDPWLHLMTKLLLLCFALLFSFLSALSQLWLNVLFGTQGRPRRLKFFYGQEASGGHERMSLPGRPHRVLLGYTSTNHKH